MSRDHINNRRELRQQRLATELARLPRWRLVLRTLPGIWVATCLFAGALSFTVGSILVQVFLNGDYYRGGSYVAVIGRYGLCGEFHGLKDWSILVCRLFTYSANLFFIYIPTLILGVLAWVVFSLSNRSPLLFLTRRERWISILLMSLPALLGVMFAFKKLPEFVLFAGPIHGFHPLMPLLKEATRLFVPAAVWLAIDLGDLKYKKAPEAKPYE